jgi:F0F1-type ATP synthase assembly protein I
MNRYMTMASTLPWGMLKFGLFCFILATAISLLRVQDQL